jgi:hypothetical protein
MTNQIAYAKDNTLLALALGLEGWGQFTIETPSPSTSTSPKVSKKIRIRSEVRQLEV